MKVGCPGFRSCLETAVYYLYVASVSMLDYLAVIYLSCWVGVNNNFFLSALVEGGISQKHSIKPSAIHKHVFPLCEFPPATKKSNKDRVKKRNMNMFSGLHVSK